ncbi:MAG: DNA alkylation repair protein [Pseudomonadota bacterium]
MSLLATLRERFTVVAEPERAPAMQAYMKSATPYLGVSAAPRRAVCKEVFAGLSWKASANWQADVLALWRGARFREERYAALELTGLRAARTFQRIDALPMYEEMIVTGAWWDYVDTIAGERLLTLLRSDPVEMRAAMLAWSVDEDMWKRRSAILCQLGAKGETDTELLTACMAPSLGSKEFFLRKAIGWALRQYARTDADWVRNYVAAHESALSGLSKREALKHIA